MWTFSAPGQDNQPADPSSTFRNLCRSSPWKWQSLRFEYLESPGSEESLVRAWLRRPGALRLEDKNGRLLASTTGINDSRDGLYVSATRKSWLLPPGLVTPIYDDAGFVRRRPEAAYGEPCFGNAHFAAALDPVELAGSAPVPMEFPSANAVELGPIKEVTHEGRQALETVVVANPGYRPLDPAFPLCFPGRTRLRIDVGTAVCVECESMDDVEPSAESSVTSKATGKGHRIRILAVDEYMLDDLFMAESMNLTDVRQHIVWNAGPAA